MIVPEKDVIDEIVSFFSDKFERKHNGKYYYADYTEEWLKKVDLVASSRDESKTSRTVKKLQENLKSKFNTIDNIRIKAEAKVAEGMTLRFDSDMSKIYNTEIDSSKLMAFDILDIGTGCAFEISLADAFAEFFKDVLKALLDSRVKKLYLCMRNHNYKGASKSGFIKVNDSPMVKQYITLAKIYKLEIILIDIFPSCNDK
jgi:hypothetical protein